MAKKRKKDGELNPPFEVVSGKLRVTDPCYDKQEVYSAVVDNVRNGKWNADVRIINMRAWGKRCAELLVWHTGYTKDDVFGKDSEMKKIEIDEQIGVDSGQAGVFDAKFYKDDKSVEGVERTGNHKPICEDEPFYSMCCDRTLSEQGWGTLPYGAVSSSGTGDGGYTAYKTVNSKGEVVGIKIVFL
jgi:hypothetical protein